MSQTEYWLKPIYEAMLNLRTGWWVMVVVQGGIVIMLTAVVLKLGEISTTLRKLAQRGE